MVWVGNPQRNAHDDDARDKRAEQVALMHRDRHRHKKADGGKVTERQHLVSRHQNSNQNSERDENQAGGDDGRMAQQQRRIETD
jgi:hypothetical protein